MVVADRDGHSCRETTHTLQNDPVAHMASANQATLGSSVRRRHLHSCSRKGILLRDRTKHSTSLLLHDSRETSTLVASWRGYTFHGSLTCRIAQCNNALIQERLC